MKFRLFFLVIFLFIAIWIYFFKPFEVAKRDHKKGATISFENFLFRVISVDGVRIFVRGRRAQSFGEELVVEDMHVRREDANLSAKKGVYADEKMLLFGDVRLRTPRYELQSSKALYYLKTGIIHISAPFELSAKDIDVRGARAVANLRRKWIRAYKVKAKVNVR